MPTTALILEKETLLRIAGPELYMQTGLQPLGAATMEDINGGSIISAAVSGFVSAVASGLGSGLVSAALSGASAAPSAVESAQASAAASAAASAQFDMLAPSD